ncbi:cellulose binding domain-containing protein [Microbispora siamensis]
MHGLGDLHAEPLREPDTEPHPHVDPARRRRQPGRPPHHLRRRWDSGSSTGYVPNWTGAYFETSFTGTTVKIKQRDAVNMYVGIDGGADVFYAGVSGTVNLTPTPLRAGTHTLRVSYRVVAGSYHGDAVFRGLVLDPGAGTAAPPVPRKLIEFVGDSITVGTTTSKNALTAYGWLIGERLSARHSQIAQGGACLVATADGCVGLEKQFVKLDANTPAPDWDFSRYTADAVVINLGTNDSHTGSAAVGGWRLTWSFPNGQQISQAWNGAYSQSGSTVTVTDAGWNAAIPAGGTAAFGFIAGQSGANGEPTAFALNGTPCAVR